MRPCFSKEAWDWSSPGPMRGSDWLAHQDDLETVCDASSTAPAPGWVGFLTSQQARRGLRFHELVFAASVPATPTS